MRKESPRLDVERVEVLEPDSARVGDIFTRLGYKIPDAIADLVDNSVDARAKNVLIRFVRSNEAIHQVVIADDGEGMDEETLLEAMRFGSRGRKSKNQLGKYGIGLKSASLSQADTVTVLSRQGKSFVGCRWTLENIKKNWVCQVLKTDGVRAAFDLNCGAFKIGRTGTIILWERLEQLRALPQYLDTVLQRAENELSIELGIRFHRFLERDALNLYIDQQFIGEPEPQVQKPVLPLNPFSYEKSGHSSYPITLRLNVGGERLDAECHIWPPLSRNSPGYRLGKGKVALRQGFYFYRNDRVIQGGGWNGVRIDDGEPHLSLARVRIDLPAQLDSIFKLDVTKSHLDPAPQFVQALHAAESNGITFAKYVEQADSVYRKQKKKDGAKFPFIPGAGIASKARKAIEHILDEEGAGRAKRVDFRWSKLDHDEVFRIDAREGVILLNLRFKKELVEGGRDDAPVLKVALLFLLQDDLAKAFQTKTSIAWCQRVNMALIASLKDG